MAARSPDRQHPDRPSPDVSNAGDDPWQDSRWFERARTKPPSRSAPTELSQKNGLPLLGLLAATAVLLWVRMLANAPHLPLTGPSADEAVVTLAPTRVAALAPFVGRPVLALVLPDGQRLDPARLGAQQTGRWIVGDADRARQQALRDDIAAALQQPSLSWQFAPNADVMAPAPSRGLAGLGLPAWWLGAMALALLLSAAVVALATPGPPASLFMLMALAQALNLLLIGAELLPGLGTTAWLQRRDLPLGWAADAVLAAAMLHLAAIYPLRQHQARSVALLAWALAAALLTGLLAGWLPGAWWWAQGWTLACGLAAAALLHRSQRHHSSPLARLLRHLVLAAVATLGLLTVAIALAAHAQLETHAMAVAGWVIWHLFVASLMLLGPFLSRSRRVAREMALLAGVSTVAASMELLLEAGLDLDPSASLLLALGSSAALYRLLRRWIDQQLPSAEGMSAERLFDSLYRVARALEPEPEHAERQIGALLREVFDPLEIEYTARTVSRIRITQDGSALVVPYSQIGVDGAPPSATGSIVLRQARQGQRLFNADDRHLAERMLEQLSRAVAYDRAVERGRTEERTRLAQDLHDDIGARLLTLMYRAPNAEIEEYIRHTLQDLKTLTRGLAASNQRLSHAAAEWKSDLSQRLNATGCDLRWSFSADRDLTLNVVQWSGLTRVIRELVNNIISHARATQVEVSVQVHRGQLLLSIVDDGIGRSPGSWSHGLGLGGVRKRVKLLGGQVLWLEVEPQGIRCEVRAPLAETQAL